MLVTRRIPENGIALLKSHFIVDVNERERDLLRGELRQKLSDVFGVVAVMANKFDRKLISELDSLRVISNFAVGYDNVDVGAATEKGIAVTNTPGVLTDASADLAFGLLLAVSRRIAEGDRLVRAEKFTGWTPMMMLGSDVSGKAIGIIGAGRIGTAVAKRAYGFGMKVFYFSHRRNDEIDKSGGEFVGLEELLRHADFISLNVPLNEETRGLIGRKEISMMKDNAILINTARGEIVDEDALIVALKKGKVAGAGLDVYKNEPKVNRKLLKLNNVVLAPHLGSATLETRAKMAEMAALNAIAVLKCEKPPSIVNPEVMRGFAA
ncbi:MAG TPA: D-glycerate dehydrogenase [Candidatus Acidoferrales bacterium]|nr:D-glycerate dehydrogenase [Candidatus Acidoferrales bacterium]